MDQIEISNMLTDEDFNKSLTQYSSSEMLFINDNNNNSYNSGQIRVDSLQCQQQFVVWSEIVFHPRYTQKQHTKLVFYDFKHNLKSIWKTNKKAICPSISPDSKYISYLELQNNGESFRYNTLSS